MKIMNNIEYEKTPLFNKLSSEEIGFIIPYLEVKKFSKSEVILAQGSRGGDLYLVLSGRISVDIILPGDYMKHLAILDKHDFFGEVTFLSDALVTASVTALESCTCIIFRHALLDMLRLSNPDISYKIESEIANQTAKKITLNINNIIKLLNTIPDDLKSPSIHEFYLKNNFKKSEELDVNKLNVNHINKLCFLNQMNDRQIRILLPLIKAKRYDKGYCFLSNEKNINKLGIVYSGAVMLFIKKNNQLEKSIALLKVGDLFLQNFIFPEFRQVADYMTCEKSIILEIDRDDYQKLYQSDPELFYIISRAINQAIASSVYIVNRQFVRINSEYNNIIS